jgi:hypothetical protein
MATRYERAAQIMPALRLIAAAKARVSYDDLATAIGGPALGMGQWLSPIQDYCEIHDLPPITVLVVNEATGEPGEGYRARESIGRDREAVYAYDWLPQRTPFSIVSSTAANRVAPTPEEFKKAEQAYATLQVEHAAR